ncbi:MAG: putative toxin-antitoxin system toxin component, PIN family [Deltaproteobacteria bacterium]|nr:putative toxin-antitoxin system toxin component, PIN family [Deltaproteobacteria bacterium]
MAKVIVDANVIISAAFGGKPLEAVVRALESHEVYVSETIIRELIGVLPGLSKKLSEEQLSFIHEKIQQLLTLATPVSLLTPVVLSRYPKDDHYLSLCKETGADFLVTGDKDLLSISQDQLKSNGISCKIVSPQDFLGYVS